MAQIAKQSTPGVVEVDATSTNNQSPYPGSSSESAAEGTGFVYDASGHIVTNEHVIDGASSVRVKLADGSTYTATVVGTDTSSDLAVLHIDAPASKLKPLELGDSSALAVGDGVVAIGNPFGLDGTVTSGIVSAINREISAPDGTPIEGAIQTDAAINHGNSGGPLFDLAGKVVGVTSQIQSDSGGNDGIGFAVPSDTVKNIAGQLIAKGSVQHALLGVTIRTVGQRRCRGGRRERQRCRQGRCEVRRRDRGGERQGGQLLGRAARDHRRSLARPVADPHRPSLRRDEDHQGDARLPHQLSASRNPGV